MLKKNTRNLKEIFWEIESKSLQLANSNATLFWQDNGKDWGITSLTLRLF